MLESSLIKSIWLHVLVIFLTICPAGKENASDVSLEVLKALPLLQQRDQSRGGGRSGDGNGRGGGSRFSGGRSGGGRNGRISNDRFSNGGGRGRGNSGVKRW